MVKILAAAVLIVSFASPAVEAGLFRHRHKSVSVVKVVTKTRLGGCRCGGGVCR
jgi:hypothetical protein